MSSQSCSFSVQDVETLWFWMRLIWDRYQCSVIFAWFLSSVLGVCNSPVATPAHGLLGFSLSLRLRFLYRRTQACLIYLCHHRRSHFTKLLTRALLFGPCHCSYIFVPHLAFRVNVAGDLDKTISFVAGVLSTSFAPALLRLIYYSPSCSMQLSIF